MSGDKTAKSKPVLTETQRQIRPVISNIGDIIDLLKSSDFEEVEDGLPPAFKGLSEPLRLTKDAFTKYSKDTTNVAAAEKDTTAAEKIKGSITFLASKAEKLCSVCRTAIRPDAEDTPALARYKSAVESPDDRVEVLTRTILEKSLEHIAKEPYITAVEVQTLKDELKKVKQLPASLPENNAEAGQHIYNNNAGGTINVKHGPGNMNINSGTGQIFDGGTFPGNLYFGGQPPPPVPTKPGG
ncbi:hypothetical protein V8F20_004038 [Naviculisporaceae sp. PSN 640]